MDVYTSCVRIYSYVYVHICVDICMYIYMRAYQSMLGQPLLGFATEMERDMRNYTMLEAHVM